jgi:hypothetical protein
MDQELVIAWLRRKAAKEANWSLLGGLGLLLAATVVLTITFWLVYVVILFGFDWLLHWKSAGYAWAALAVVALLFLANAHVDREELTEFKVGTGTVTNEVFVFCLPGVGVGSNVNPLHADTMRTGVRMVADLVLTGPRLVNSAWRSQRRCCRVRRLDLEAAAEVFALLLTNPHKVPFAELLSCLDRRDPVQVFGPLRDLEGVLFLQAPPAGVALTPEFRAEFSQAVRSGL